MGIHRYSTAASLGESLSRFILILHSSAIVLLIHTTTRYYIHHLLLVYKFMKKKGDKLSLVICILVIF